MILSDKLASSKSWVIEITVNPNASLISRTTSMIAKRPFGSNIDVASSSMIISGLNATIPAIATRCFCPPDSRAGSFVLNLVISTRERAVSTRASISSRDTP